MDAIEHLSTIRRLWPLLDTTPGRGRRDPVRETTAAARARALERWQDEQTDKLAGAVGRGASPAACNLDVVDTKITVQERLFELADQVAERTQLPEPRPRRQRITRVSLSRVVSSVVIHRQPDTWPDDDRWRYSASYGRGVPWACTWLINAYANSLPIDLNDAVDAAAEACAHRVRTAYEGQTVRDAGPCPACRTPMTVAPWDELITCPGCRTSYGRRQWLRIAAGRRA